MDDLCDGIDFAIGGGYIGRGVRSGSGCDKMTGRVGGGGDKRRLGSSIMLRGGSRDDDGRCSGRD